MGDSTSKVAPGSEDKNLPRPVFIVVGQNIDMCINVINLLSI